MLITVESAAGSTITAPVPCAARITTMSVSFQASPQASEPSVKTVSPSRKIRRRPRRSAAQEQQAAEGRAVRRDHPPQTRLGEVQFAADAQQGDADDCHEAGDGEHRECLPAMGRVHEVAAGHAASGSPV
ncbi:hypothetical protein [Streptomyces hokutonensis]|uniref:hypothetical protein n=1 Tax=Streptomyces hokutonensis TaxID=1306990 RepID=UPI0037F60703